MDEEVDEVGVIGTFGFKEEGVDLVGGVGFRDERGRSFEDLWEEAMAKKEAQRDFSSGSKNNYPQPKEMTFSSFHPIRPHNQLKFHLIVGTNPIATN